MTDLHLKPEISEAELEGAFGWMPIPDPENPGEYLDRKALFPMLRKNIRKLAGDWDMTGAQVPAMASPAWAFACSVENTEAGTSQLNPGAPLIESASPGFYVCAAGTQGAVGSGAMKFIQHATDPSDNWQGVQIVLANAELATLNELLAETSNPTEGTYYFALQYIAGSVSFAAAVNGVASAAGVPGVGSLIAGDSLYLLVDKTSGEVRVQKNDEPSVLVATYDFSEWPVTRLFGTAIFSADTAALTAGYVTFDYSADDGGRTPFMMEGDAILPEGASDGARYHVTVPGIFNGKATKTGDIVEVYNSESSLIIYRLFDEAQVSALAQAVATAQQTAEDANTAAAAAQGTATGADSKAVTAQSAADLAATIASAAKGLASISYTTVPTRWRRRGSASVPINSGLYHVSVAVDPATNTVFTKARTLVSARQYNATTHTFAAAVDDATAYADQGILIWMGAGQLAVVEENRLVMIGWDGGAFTGQVGNSLVLSGVPMEAACRLSDTRLAVWNNNNLFEYVFDGTDWSIDSSSSIMSQAIQAMTAVSETEIIGYSDFGNLRRYVKSGGGWARDPLVEVTCAREAEAMTYTDGVLYLLSEQGASESAGLYVSTAPVVNGIPQQVRLDEIISAGAFLGYGGIDTIPGVGLVYLTSNEDILQVLSPAGMADNVGDADATSLATVAISINSLRDALVDAGLMKSS